MDSAMKKIVLYALCSLFPVFSLAQIVKLGERFTTVPVIEEKVTFLKEIPMKSDASASANYKLLREWAAANYGRDPFISSVRYDAAKNEFIAKSRVELLLPPNSKGVREKMVMRYRINGFLFRDKCVLEITEISYLYGDSGRNKLLPKVIRAEDFITDKAITTADQLQEYRVNTRKSTLYFLEELSKSFEEKFGY
jgi:hypothetical protein